MPKVKRSYDKYEKLKVLLNGHMALLELDYTQVAAIAFPQLRQGRVKVSKDFKDPERISLGELSRYAFALDIPSEELRAAIPIR